MAEYRTVTISAAVSENCVNAAASVADSAISANASLNTTITTISMPEYTGPYVVTPAAEAQILETSAMAMTANVTINPIPSNYGLITWNGSALTVS